MAIKIDGGLGRIVAALPALTARNELVITNGWQNFYQMTKLRNIESTSNFIGELLKDESVVTPEPYHRLDYRKGELNMVEAFNKELGVNGTDYGLVPSKSNMKQWVAKLSSLTNLPIALIQIRGSNHTHDINQDNLNEIFKACNELKLYPVIFGDLPEYEIQGAFIATNTSEFDIVSLVALSTVVFGCDSCGMHLAKALQKPCVAFLTATAGINYYPYDHIEYRHPINNTSIETPRLFAGEVTTQLENEKIDYHYVVPAEIIVKDIMAKYTMQGIEQEVVCEKKDGSCVDCDCKPDIDAVVKEVVGTVVKGNDITLTEHDVTTDVAVVE